MFVILIVFFLFVVVVVLDGFVFFGGLVGFVVNLLEMSVWKVNNKLINVSVRVI